MLRPPAMNGRPGESCRFDSPSFLNWLKLVAKDLNIEIISEKPLIFENKNIGCIFDNTDQEPVNVNGLHYYKETLDTVLSHSSSILPFGFLPSITQKDFESYTWSASCRQSRFFTPKLYSPLLFPIRFRREVIHSVKKPEDHTSYDYILETNENFAVTYDGKDFKRKCTSEQWHFLIPHFYTTLPIHFTTGRDEDYRKHLLSNQPDMVLEWIKFIHKIDETCMVKFKLLEVIGSDEDFAKFQTWVNFIGDTVLRHVAGREIYKHSSGYCEDCDYTYESPNEFQDHFDMNLCVTSKNSNKTITTMSRANINLDIVNYIISFINPMWYLCPLNFAARRAILRLYRDYRYVNGKPFGIVERFYDQWFDLY